MSDHCCRILDERVHSHNVEKGEICCQSRSTFFYQLHHWLDVEDFGSEWGWDWCLGLGQWKTDLGLFQCSTIVGAVAAHAHDFSKVLVNWYDFSLLVWFGPRKYHCSHKKLFQFFWIFHVILALENLCKNAACQTYLMILIFFSDSYYNPLNLKVIFRQVYLNFLLVRVEFLIFKAVCWFVKYQDLSVPVCNLAL